MKIPPSLQLFCGHPATWPHRVKIRGSYPSHRGTWGWPPSQGSFPGISAQLCGCRDSLCPISSSEQVGEPVPELSECLESEATYVEGLQHFFPINRFWQRHRWSLPQSQQTLEAGSLQQKREHRFLRCCLLCTVLERGTRLCPICFPSPKFTKREVVMAWSADVPLQLLRPSWDCTSDGKGQKQPAYHKVALNWCSGTCTCSYEAA